MNNSRRPNDPPKKDGKVKGSNPRSWNPLEDKEEKPPKGNKNSGDPFDPSDSSSSSSDDEEEKESDQAVMLLLAEFELLLEEIRLQSDLSDIHAPKLLEAMFPVLKELQKELRHKAPGIYSLRDKMSKRELKEIQGKFPVHNKMLQTALQEISAKLEDRKQTVKLPPIELIKFDGQYQHWVPFKQLFEQLVHKRKDLSDTEKMTCNQALPVRS